VVFDVGHGAASFWFRLGQAALEAGFLPDSISTDLHTGNMNGPVHSMLNVMSKFLNMGMELSDVITRSTVNPAREIGRPDLGTLTPGSEADIAVLNLCQGDCRFWDCGRASLAGSRNLECILTFRTGKVVFDRCGLAMQEWRDAPAPYWHTPQLQG
jgi:dihydroorotase